MELLYHYCPTQTFWSIVASRTIRLSSLSLSNDTMEGKLVADAFKRLAERDELDANTMDGLQNSLELLEQLADGLGFCLSEEGDLLSQWRGYADDGSGVSIGFSRQHLSWLRDSRKERGEPSFDLYRVVYEPDSQDEQVEPTYQEAKRFIDQGAYRNWGLRSLLDTRSNEEFEREKEIARKANISLAVTLLALFPKLFVLKGPAFREEREWRLISYFTRNGTDKCLYQACQDRVIPYRELKLFKSDIGQPIKEVILGPKHISSPVVVEDFLDQNGFEGVQVRRSEASYR